MTLKAHLQAAQAATCLGGDQRQGQRLAKIAPYIVLRPAQLKRGSTRQITLLEGMQDIATWDM